MNYQTLINKSIKDLRKKHNLTQEQFCEKIEEQCGRTSWGKPNNLGFVAMLFGYDAILGQAGQLDILNMKKAYIVDEGWGL